MYADRLFYIELRSTSNPSREISASDQSYLYLFLIVYGRFLFLLHAGYIPKPVIPTDKIKPDAKQN